MTSIRRPLLVALAAAVLADVPAGATPPPQNSFSGWCSVAGVSRYDEPMTWRSRDNVFHSFARGSCWGRVNGVGSDSSQWTVETAADGPFRGSCYESRSTAPAPGRLRFTMDTAEQVDDVVIGFTMTFRSDPVHASPYELRGETSGEMRGEARFGTIESAPREVLSCQTDGLRESPFTASAHTVTPLVGPAPSSSTEPPSPPVEPAAHVLSSGLRRVLAEGLRVRCRAEGPAACRLAAYITRSAARRHGLSRKRIGSARARIPRGDSVVDLFVELRPRARRALRRADSLRVRVGGVVVQGVSERAVGDSRRLRR